MIALETYLKKGYSKSWVNQRLKSIEVRKDLTDEWETRGVKKGQEYAILTDEITKAWSGFSVKQYKEHKGLKKENPSGQYDRSRIGAEYVSLSHYHGN